MSITLIFTMLSFISFVIITWLLATKNGREKMKAMQKKTKTLLFIGAGVLVAATCFMNAFFTLTSNPNELGRRSNKPADIHQVVEIEGYEIEVTEINHTKGSYYLQGDYNTKYGPLAVKIHVSCQTTEESCPDGRFTMTLPNNHYYDSTWIGLDAGEEETITLKENIPDKMDTSEYSPVSIEFLIEEPNRFYSAYFEINVDE